MKYKTFARLRTFGCLGLVLVSGIACLKRFDRPKDAATPSSPPVVSGPATSDEMPPLPPEPATPLGGQPKATGGDSLALSELDHEVLQSSKAPLTNGTADSKGRKWRQKGDRMTLELRQDADKSPDRWNRAKVDRNNNKKFDELWDFSADGSAKKRVAPNDDENYTVELRLKPGATSWTKKK